MTHCGHFTFTENYKYCLSGHMFKKLFSENMIYYFEIMTYHFENMIYVLF